MTRLYMDLESIPAPDARERLTAGVKCDGRITKPESIAEWERTKRPEAEEQAYRAGSLQALFGQILTIAWAVDDEPVKSIAASGGEICERVLLTKFFDDVWGLREPTLIGHAVATFDCPFVWQRAKILGVPLPSWWPTPMTPPWQANVYDTKLAWSGSTDRSRSASLVDLCWRFGIPCKSDGIDGSKVYDEYLAGNIAGIEAYNREDVEAVRALHLKLTT